MISNYYGNQYNIFLQTRILLPSPIYIKVVSFFLHDRDSSVHKEL